MRECPNCRCCFPDDILHCPDDGSATNVTISGEPILDGRYELEKRLGSGGMGVVYKARHVFLRTAHAVKVILPDLVGNDPNLVTRFRQEALALAAIRHQNIIAVTDFGVVGGRMPFLVMEFVQGRSLQDVMADEGAMSPQRAFELMQAICAGISAAHRQHIIHRDLKPLNVMIQDNVPVNEGVKILDFGLAKIKSGELLGSFVAAQTTGLMGSPFYMAPEQWSDEPPDARADVYSLGVMLYQMLSDEVPFKGKSIPAIMKKHLTEGIPTFASKGINIPLEIEAVVRHALEKDPQHRTVSAEALMSELREAMAAASARLERTGAIPRMDPLQTLPMSTPAFEEEQQKLRAEREAARAEEEKRRRAEEEQKKLLAQQEAARIENEKRQRAEEEQKKLLAQQEAARAEEEKRQRAEEEQKKLLAQQEAARVEEEKKRQRAEEEQKKLLAQQEAARLEEEERKQAAAEAEERRLAEMKRQADEAARERERQVELEQARLKREAEEKQRLLAEEQKQRAEAEAARAAERRRQEELAAARAREEKIAQTAPPVVPKQPAGIAGQATHMQRIGVTTGGESLSGSSAHPFPAANAAVIANKKSATLPIALAAVLVVLIGGGIGAYFVYRARASARVVPAAPVDPLNVAVKADLVDIPAGSFQMGREDSLQTEGPAHAVTVNAFEMDKTEVTNLEYAQFVKQTNHAPPSQWGGTRPPAGDEQVPVSNVSYEDAIAFARWRSQRDGVTYRLPTEEEWEYAARNGDKNNLYPWGDTWQSGNAVTQETGAIKADPVGKHPQGADRWGVQDLMGNVYEWTSSKASLYPGNPLKLPDQYKDWIVIRGGGYGTPTNNMSGTRRDWFASDYKSPLLGFRLVKTAP